MFLLRGRAVTLLCLSLLTFAACDRGSDHSVTDNVGLGGVADTSVSCPVSGSDAPSPTAPGGQGMATPSGPLPASFVPVSVTECVLSTELVPGDGEWNVTITQRSTSGVDALARALREASVSPKANLACASPAFPPIRIVVTNAAGSDFAPDIPTGECGAPLPGVVAALASMRWSRFGAVRTSQTRTQLEVTSGCSGQYKPVLAMVGSEAARQVPPGSVVPATTTGIRVCRYGLDSTSTIRLGGTTLDAGELTGAATVTGPDLARVSAALNHTSAVASCSTAEQAPFAVLTPVDSTGDEVAGAIYVELGGCGRVLLGSSMRQLSASVTQLLAGLSYQTS
jgi:hypothetical protein